MAFAPPALLSQVVPLSHMQIAAIARSPRLLEELASIAAEFGRCKLRRIFDGSPGRPALEVIGDDPMLSVACMNSKFDQLIGKELLQVVVSAPSAEAFEAFQQSMNAPGAEAQLLGNVGAVELARDGDSNAVRVSVLRSAMPTKHLAEQVLVELAGRVRHMMGGSMLVSALPV